MAFQEIRLSTKISFGAHGGPAFSTDVVPVRSGFETRNENWAQAQHRYEIGLTVRKKSEFDLVRDFFMVVGGKRDGFRYKDFADFQFSTTVGRLYPLLDGDYVGVAGMGYGIPTYQIVKQYTVGSSTYSRAIFKPVTTPAVAVYRAAVLQTLTTNYTIDYTTGRVTFVADQTRAISSHAVGATHQVVLASAFSPNLLVGGRIYFTGVTGTAATLLNGSSHAITIVSSATITTSTVTTGLTASGGSAFIYAQPTEALTVSGEFDVPVRFDVDHFDAVIVQKQAMGELLIELPSVPLIELKL